MFLDTFDIFTTFIFDTETGQQWTGMTDAQRAASAINDPNLVWNGPIVTSLKPYLTDGFNSGFVRLYAPNPYDVGSSVSHYTTDASPNLLMEPYETYDFVNGVDLTAQLFQEIGWPFNSSALANLTITQSDSADPVPPSTQFSYIMSVTNAGLANADAVRVTDTLPGAVTFVSATNDANWSCSHLSGTVTCDWTGSLNSGATSTDITITVMAPGSGTSLSNTASVITITPESDYSNNNANESTVVGIPTLVTLIKDSFSATVSERVVTLTWETATEFNNAGFFIWRGQLLAGKTECSLNPEDYTEVKRISTLVLAQGESGSGASYYYQDEAVESGNTYCYALEDVELDGTSTFHLDDIPSASVP